MEQQPPPTIQESGKLKGPRLPGKYKFQIFLGVLSVVAALAFARAWLEPPALGPAAKAVLPKALGKNDPIDLKTPEEVQRRYEMDARQSIRDEAIKDRMQGNGGSLYGLGALLGRGNQPPQQPQQQGLSGYPYQTTYNAPPVQTNPKVEERKRQAIEAAEREKQAYVSSKSSSVVLSFNPQEALIQKAAVVKKGDSEERSIRKEEIRNSQESPSPLHTLYQGTIIDGALVNGLKARYTGPVKTIVTTDVYSKDRIAVLIKAGSYFLGEADKIAETGMESIAISYSRMLRTDGYSVNFEDMPGLSQQGETGVQDKVNHHYVRTFAVAGAMGLLSGFAMAGSGGYYENGWNRYRDGFADSMSRIGMMTFNRFLMMPWDVTIRPGWRMEIMLTKDLELPPYQRTETE